MKRLLIRGHLGMGDQLIICGLVKAKDIATNIDSVALVCLIDHLDTLSLLYQGTEVTLVPVGSELSADSAVKDFDNAGWSILQLGQFGHSFDVNKWDREFYRQAGADYKLRENFTFALPEKQIQPPSHRYIFVHDDPSRGFNIKRSNLPYLPIYNPNGWTENSLFSYWAILQGAEEIHCIDSSFLVFVDQCKANFDSKTKRVYHKYAKHPPNPPVLLSEWEIIT